MTEFAERVKSWACTEQAKKVFDAAQALTKDPAQRSQIAGVRERLMGLTSPPAGPAEAPPVP